jgi:hypothetical protein
MEVDLKDFFQSIAVGGFALFLIWAWLRSGPVRLYNFVKSYAPSRENTMVQYVVYVPLFLALGMFIETISSKEWFNKCLKQQDRDLVLRHLAGVSNLNDTAIQASSHPLLLRLLKVSVNDSNLVQESTNLVDLMGVKWTNQSNQIVLQLSPLETTRTFRIEGEKKTNFMAAFEAIYFTAKNRVVRNPTYHAELSRIESRANFARAFALLCSAAFVAFAILILGPITDWLVKKFYCREPKCVRCDGVVHWLSRFEFRPYTDEDPVVPNQFHALIVALVLLLSAWFIADIYSRERGEYHRRVAGYFVSLLQFPKD